MENEALSAIGKTLYEMYLTLERIAQLQEKQCYAALKKAEPASIHQQAQDEICSDDVCDYCEYWAMGCRNMDRPNSRPECFKGRKLSPMRVRDF